MNSYKYLFKNIGLLAVSQFATKILAFFLVPLYTSVLSTSEYGTYDLFATTINLLMPILTLNVCESIIVYTLDKNYKKNEVISIGIKYSFIGFIFSFLFLFFNYFFKIFPSINKYWYFLPVMLLLTALNASFSYFARGTDKVVHTAIAGILSSIVLISSNIIFLLIIKIGLFGYFIAQILALMIQIIYLFFSCHIYKYIVIPKDKKMEKDMRNFSYPLIANNIGWWINNSSDRYIVTLMCGVAANGIYSVGYKIPSILNMFQTIFSQAWTISAVKDFDPEDKNNFFSNTYSMYNCGMTIVCSFLISISRFLAYFLYSKDFFMAWKYVPWLTIAIVFGALSGFLGGVFSAAKDSEMFGKSTVIGAIVNIIFNILLVHFVGAIGAAIATTISYVIVWVIRLVHVKKYIKIKINLIRDSLAYLILLIQGSLLFVFSDGTKLYIGEFIMVVCVFFLFKKNLMAIINKIVYKIKR